MEGELEYQAVLMHFNSLVESLKVSRESLITQFQMKKWLDITTRASEKTLVQVALGRIQQDARQFEIFVHMLRNVTGLEDILQRITGTGVLGI